MFQPAGGAMSDVYSQQDLTTYVGTTSQEHRTEHASVSHAGNGDFTRHESLESDLTDRIWNNSVVIDRPQTLGPLTTKIDILHETLVEHDKDKHVIGGPGYEATRLETSDETTITDSRHENVEGETRDTYGSIVANWTSDSLVESQDLIWQYKHNVAGHGTQQTKDTEFDSTTVYEFSESSGGQGYGSQKSEVNKLWTNNPGYGYGGVVTDGNGGTIVIINGTSVATNSDSRSSSFAQTNSWDSKFESETDSTSRDKHGVISKFKGNEQSTDSGLGSSSGQMSVSVLNEDPSQTMGMFGSNSQYAGNFTWNFGRETDTSGDYDSEPRLRSIVDAESSYSESGSGTYSGISTGMGTQVGVTELVDLTDDHKTDSSSFCNLQFVDVRHDRRPNSRATLYFAHTGIVIG